MTLIFRTLSDIEAALGQMPGPDLDAERKWTEREKILTKPQGSLGRLEDISRFLCLWQGRHPPAADRVAVRIFAGNHGIAARGVSAWPAEVTRQMVDNFDRGGAAINQLCKNFNLDLSIRALDLDHPTKDISEEAAMNEEECVAAFSAGMDAVPDDLDIVALGEMGIGNTTSAAAISYALFGGDSTGWVGRGTGIDDEHYRMKADLTAKAVRRLGEDRNGLRVLAHLGGRELAAMAGAILAARLKRIPVLLDGYVCCAAASCLWAANKEALDHCLVSHVSAEPGHRLLLERLGRAPLLSFDMRLGEGTGAALAAGLAKAAIACHNGMASFSEAGVSEKS